MQRSTRKRFTYQAGVAAIAALGLAPGSLAQETNDDVADDTVVVIGTRMDLALGAPAGALETPASTSSVATETLLELGGTTMLDALRTVPGAQADLSFVGSHSQVVVLRGAIADNGTQNSRVLRDGARLSNYAFTPAFVDQINVIRGPGAAAAVRSEPGGTVEIVTKSAELENFGTAYARIGEDNAQEIWLDVNRVLSADKGLAARAVLVSSAASEWRHVEDTLEGLKFNITKTEGDRYRIAFDFEATNQTYQPDFGIPAVNNAPADVPLDRQLSEPFGDSETNNRIFSLSSDYRLADGVRLNFDYTHLDGETLSIRNSVFREIAGPPGTFMRVTAYEPNGDRDIDAVSSSIVSVVETGALEHNLFAGAEYYRETLNLPRLSVPAANSPPINVYDPVYGLTSAPTGPLAESLTKQDSRTVIVTLQDRMEFGRFNLVAGLQYVNDDSYYGPVGTIPATEERVSPRLGLTYAITPSQMVYASYSTGTSPQYVSTATNESVPMRLSEQYEAGWKGEFLDGRVRADFAAYRLEQDRTLSADPDVARTFRVNGGMRSQGIEASLTGDVSDRLSMGIAYAYTDAEYLAGSLYPFNQAPNVPYNSGNIFAQMQWDEHWRSGINIYAQGDRFADEPNLTTLPGYATVDLVQAFTFMAGGNPLELQLNVRNLFDEEYIAASHLHFSNYLLPAEGRNVSLSLMYNF